MNRVPRIDVNINDHFLAMERDMRGPLANEASRTGLPMTKESVIRAWDGLLPETQLAIINRHWWQLVDKAHKLNIQMLRIRGCPVSQRVEP